MDVLLTMDYYDGPRDGLATFGGSSIVFYRSLWGECATTDLYLLIQPTAGLVATLRDSWAAWTRSPSTYHAEAVEDNGVHERELRATLERPGLLVDASFPGLNRLARKQGSFMAWDETDRPEVAWTQVIGAETSLLDGFTQVWKP